MKLFIREQLPLLVIYSLQLFLLPYIFWLDGYRHYRIIFYAVGLSLFIFIGYLSYRYIANRSFYHRLENPLTSIDDIATVSTHTPLGKSLHHLLFAQLRFYRNDLRNYQQKLEAHIQFIHQWVHQMKTPVSVIHLMIQDKDEKDYMAIGDELDRLKKGLDMVLYTARLDTFERDFFVGNLHLETVVRAVVSAQKRLFIRKRIFPVFQMDDQITIASDEKWLSFVLMQLITNAVRYTVEENRKIYFRSFKKGTNTLLEVEDEGIGIPKSDLPRVFNPYFTGENGRNFQESTGMGLALVKQICEKLGAKIEIDSCVNKGTIVRIIF